MNLNDVKTQFDLEEIKDTSSKADSPAEWVAEATAEFLQMLLLSIPAEFGPDAKQKANIIYVLDRVLKRLYDRLTEMNEKGKTYKPLDTVGWNEFDLWVEEAIMQFLRGSMNMISSQAFKDKGWTTDEVLAAQPEGIRLLINDLDKS